MDKRWDISDEKNKEAKRVLLLNERVKRCVCKSCGGKLSLRMLDFDEFEKTRIDIFCDKKNPPRSGGPKPKPSEAGAVWKRGAAE